MAGLGVVKKEKTEITIDDLKQRFPAKKNTITDEVVDLLNQANSDPQFNGNEFLENMTTYQNVMYNNSGSLTEYINALKFCSYLEADVNNYTEAYRRARANDQFVIDRANLPKDSVGYRELTNAASRFRKTPMVRDILTLAEMPLYLMFQGARYGAVSKLIDEMETAPFSKDRISAAKAILENVKPPEKMDIEMKIGPNQQAVDLQSELNAQLAKLASNQKALLESGMDIRDVQKTGLNLNITEAEIVDE